MAAFGVLFVCVGNVCRSPFAERLLRLRLAQAGAAPGDYRVTSVGTRAVQGAPMTEPMRVRLEALGGDGDGFAARQLQPPPVERAGLVLTATRDVRSHVLQEVPSAMRRTYTMLELAGLAAHAPSGIALSEAIRSAGEHRTHRNDAGLDVTDPIGRSAQVHDQVTAQIDQAVTALTRLLVSNIPDDPRGRRPVGTRARR